MKTQRIPFDKRTSNGLIVGLGAALLLMISGGDMPDDVQQLLLVTLAGFLGARESTRSAEISANRTPAAQAGGGGAQSEIMERLQALETELDELRSAVSGGDDE